MVCKEMGFLEGAKEAKKGPHSGSSASLTKYRLTGLKFVMDNVFCFGNEIRLSNCNFTSSHNCERGEEAGVICIGEY